MEMRNSVMCQYKSKTVYIIVLIGLAFSMMSVSSFAASNQGSDHSQPNHLLLFLAHNGMASAQFELGHFYFDQHQYLKAIPYFQQAAKNDDDFIKMSRYNIGAAYWNQAVKIFNKNYGKPYFNGKLSEKQLYFSYTRLLNKPSVPVSVRHESV
jgi:tetratricopeptide (TPR) repeat protein